MPVGGKGGGFSGQTIWANEQPAGLPANRSGLTLASRYTQQPTSALTDDFDDNTKDTSKWGADAPWRLPADDAVGVTISEANGRTEIVGPASTGGNHIAGRVSANLLSLFDSEIVFSLGSSTGTIVGSTEDVYLSFGQDTNNHYLVLVRKAATVQVTLYTIVAGSLGSGTTYDTGGSSLPAWIRLRYVSSTDHVMVDTATSGASNPPLSGDWTNRVDVASTGGISLTAGYAAYGAGTWAITTPTTFYFDGFNTATVASAGSVTGTGALSEANDTASATGSVDVSGSVTRTEASDTAAGTGASTVTGSVSSTEANDTASGSGGPTVSGTVTRTEANDTAALSGSVSVTGTITRTEASDTASGTGSVSVSGSGASTEASDSASLSGSVVVSGSLARTEANDTCSISGTVGSSAITGTATQPVAPTGPHRPRRRRLKVTDYGMILPRPERR